MHSSGNIVIRNWVHLVESHCIFNKLAFSGTEHLQATLFYYREFKSLGNYNSGRKYWCQNRNRYRFDLSLSL